MANQVKLVSLFIVINALITLIVNVNTSKASLIPGLGLVDNRDARVINALGQGLALKAKCKTKDKDYGNQIIKYGKYHEFHVDAKTGDIKCAFQWDEKVHTFEIYNMKRYKEECGERCWWMVKETGACLFDMESKSHIYCYPFEHEKQQ